MEPIAESLEALTRLSSTADADLVQGLRDAAARVVEAAPFCVGLSISYFDAELTFTLLATSERLRILDAAQYLDEGPCQVAALDGEEVQVGELSAGDQWHLLAAAGASIGVSSSLSLPIRRSGRRYGSVNFYGSRPEAFTDKERDLALIFGAAVQEAVANADLTMSSVQRARLAVEKLDARDTINQAVGVLAVKEGVPVEDAKQRLQSAADRAGVSAVALAQLLLRERVG